MFDNRLTICTTNENRLEVNTSYIMTSIEDVASPKKSEMMNSQLWLWLRADMALEWQIVMGPGLIWKKLNKII